MKKIGIIENYFSKIGVAVFHLTDDELKKGEKIHIKGSTTDFEQIVDSIQIDRIEVEVVAMGLKGAIKVNERVRENDEVFKID